VITKEIEVGDNLDYENTDELQINIHSKQKNTIQKGSLDKRSV
jgi:hypothetical protein